jgi:O-antigen ligase
VLNTPAISKWWLPVWLFTLTFTYPIPHTIALRNLLLVAGLVACLWGIFRDRTLSIDRQRLRAFRPCGWLLLILSGWLLFQSALISPLPQQALDHLRGDWFNELLVALAGGSAALLGHRHGFKRPCRAIMLALFSHIALFLGYQAWQWMQTGRFPLGQTPFAQKDYHSMILTTLIALLLAEVAIYASARQHPCQKKPPPQMASVIGMLAVCFVATATLLARNAVIITLCMLMLSAGIFFYAGHQRLGKKTVPALILLLLFTAGVGWAGIRSDARWQGFFEAARVAFDTQNNLAWMDSEKYPRPLMRNGEQVEESAYLRLAWAKVAVEQIQNYPLGLGYGHQAFGWAINRSYHVDTTHESSHSGLLDFTLANGIPGLILWLALSGALIQAGWRAFREEGSAAGLMLTFSVVAYLVRCLLDGHLSGFRLEMYALLVGTLIMAQVSEKSPCS